VSGAGTEGAAEAGIREWRRHLEQAGTIRPGEAEELEAHLRDELDGLTAAGLDADEAFLIAVRRLGAIHAISAEFARSNSARLWKQLVLPAPTAERGGLRDLWWALGIGLLAAIAVQIVLGIRFGGPLGGAIIAPTAAAPALVALIPIGALVAWLLVRRRARGAVRILVAIAPPLVLAAVLVLGPLDAGADASGQWFAIAISHTPIAAWLGVGLAYLGSAWRSSRRRMDLVRFTGEFVIYYTLVAIGGYAFALLAVGIIVPAFPESLPWILQWGLGSAAVIAVPAAAWLVEAKQQVIETLAPILARIFLPIAAGVSLIAAALYLVGGAERGFDRDFMVVLDVLLVLVLGLLLYHLSARGESRWNGFFDAAALLAILGALVLDAMLLADMVLRVADYGWTANRIVALGLNLILVAVLAGAAILSALHLAGRSPIARLERWLMATLPVYSIWAGLVVIVLPFVPGLG